MRPGDIIVSPMPRTLYELRVPAALLIGLLWTIAFFVGVATNSYIALATTTPLVVIAAGAIFTLRNGNGNGNGNGKK